jgi:hypothetical protein
MRYLLILCVVLATSCSLEKRIARSVKKHGAKETAAHIAREYPEYLRADTVRKTIVQEVQVEVKVPEVKIDTVYKTDTLNNCQAFKFSDKNLSIEISEKNGKTKVDYKIKERGVKDVVKVETFVEIPCPPCPTVEIVQEVKEHYEGALMKQIGKKKFYRNGFLILTFSWMTLIIFLIFRTYLKTIFPFIK